MIAIYPSNRLENLVQLFDQMCRVAPLERLLEEEIVLVQNQAMFHWLNQRIALQRGICMNMRYAMPGQFIWWLLRRLLGPEQVPERSPFEREVLVWRIHDLLGSDTVIANPLCREATDYWRINDRADELKRYQLADKLADLFEQYLLYRPDWIDRWDHTSATHWQAVIWQILTTSTELHPLALMKAGLDRLERPHQALPERISLFSINAMPPVWVDFITAIGKRVQVHVFHLNPCVEYWGDLQSEKQLARWMKLDDASTELGNPLLANLGEQGRAFIRQLQDRVQIEIPVFESQSEASKTGQSERLLHRIQADILRLIDARNAPERCKDESLTLVSAHSALREVQGLHDWLLHQFDTDAELTPGDILIMAPEVEQYAPYVQAVFSDQWQMQSDPPRLPCTISDRVQRDMEPLVEAYSQLLKLPDSRFEVSQVLALLLLPPVQRRFQLNDDDVVLINHWLKRAAIHWGLDTEHREGLLNQMRSSDDYTWQQGLRRLLLGFANGDRAEWLHSQWLLPDVEGDNGILLGRLIELIELMRNAASQLSGSCGINQWVNRLHQLKTTFFMPADEDEHAFGIIDDAITDLAETGAEAGFEPPLGLPVVREYLTARFSRPEPGRRFMSGMITFCSMVPMRSLPFKIIAVLGLNDGEFPRQRLPVGFDLMAEEGPRMGDRSLRGDDRYLFLEAMISAREKLYLSYQGRDIKNDEPRQPSPVLRELMDYLQRGYSWETSGMDAPIQWPLQPYADACFKPPYVSYDSGWFNLNPDRAVKTEASAIGPLEDAELSGPISIRDLSAFHVHPPMWFARTRLGLYLDTDVDEAQTDEEPFEFTYLDRYLIQSELIQAELDGESLNERCMAMLASGQYPSNPRSEPALDEWRDSASLFAGELRRLGFDRAEIQRAQLEISGTVIEAELNIANDQLVLWRPATPKPKDLLSLWLHHLFAQSLLESGADHGVQATSGLYWDHKSGIVPIELAPVEHATDLLAHWVDYWRQGMQQPWPLNAELGLQCASREQAAEQLLSQAWQPGYLGPGLSDDPYYRYFWSHQPSWDDGLQQAVDQLYRPLVDAVGPIK